MEPGQEHTWGTGHPAEACRSGRSWPAEGRGQGVLVMGGIHASLRQ